MTIEISYNSHGANLVLYAIILDKSNNIYSPEENLFTNSNSSITYGKIPLIGGRFNSYQSSIPSSSFATGSYTIRVYQRESSNATIIEDETVEDAIIKDTLLHVSEFNWDAHLQKEVDSLDSNCYLPELLSYGVDQTYIVKVNDGGFQVNDKDQPVIKLKRGGAYRFDQSHMVNEGHLFRMSTSADGDHNSGLEYSKGTTYSGSSGTLGSYHIFEVPADAPPKLYYYCKNHPNMGGVIEISGGNINDYGNNNIEITTKRGSSDDDGINIITR